MQYDKLLPTVNLFSSAQALVFTVMFPVPEEGCIMINSCCYGAQALVFTVMFPVTEEGCIMINSCC